MTDRILFFSDLHIHQLQSDWRRVDDALDVLDWIYQTAIDRKVNKVWFLGDWFHVRGYMYPSIVARSYRKLLKFQQAGIEMLLLVGNHDCPHKHATKENSLTAFNSIFPVIEQPMVYEGDDWNFYFLPYVEDTKKLNWAIDKLAQVDKQEYRSGNVIRRKNSPPEEEKKTCLLAHMDIYDAIYHNGVRSVNGVNSKTIKDKFDLVLTGHYHQYQQIHDNVYYIGSPYQQNFGESGQKKGCLLFDNGKLEFIENTFSPVYMYATPENITSEIENNYVKFITSKEDNISDIYEKSEKFNPREISIRFGGSELDYSGEKLVELQTSAKDVKSLLAEWVDRNANSDLYDPDKLLKIGYDIIGA